MNDTCDILRWSEGSDEYTDGLDTWAADSSSTEIRCGFRYNRFFDSEKGQLTTLSGNAILRIGLDVEIGAKDKIVVDGESWLVDGEAFVGRSVQIANLRKADTNE